jgi:hypothetical protein
MLFLEPDDSNSSWLDAGMRFIAGALVQNAEIAHCPLQTNYKLRGHSPRANYIFPFDRRLSAKLVPTFADGECHVVSVTDPYGVILAFLDWNR